MNVQSLADLLLSPDEKPQLYSSLELLSQDNAPAFYEKNPQIIQNILFLETLQEFLDFSREDRLDTESYCAAFLCAKGYGIQVGGYEDDLTGTLTDFFQTKNVLYPEIAAILSRETIYTDCGDVDNFKPALAEINQNLEPHGVQLTVLEDFVYCDCEYTLLLTETALARRAAASWDSGQFELYL